jgi:hypothetical protein
MSPSSSEPSDPVGICQFDVSLAKDGFCNGIPVKLVPFDFSACALLTIHDDTQGIDLPGCTNIPVITSFQEDVALCLPAPLGESNIFCNITNVLCTAKLVPFDQSVLLTVTLCKEITVEADVKLETLAAFCHPRGLCPTTTPVPPTCPSFPVFPPQCQSLFPGSIIPTIAPTSAPTPTPTAFPSPSIPVPTTPICILSPECIRVRKLYDWIVDQNTYTNKITLPEACIRTIQAALQAGHQLSVRCSIIPCCQPMIQMTISPTSNPCSFDIRGTVTCSDQPVQSGEVNFDVTLSGSGSVNVMPNPAPITNGIFTATLTATQPTTGTATVTATTTVNGETVSTVTTTSVNCPPPPPTQILAPGGEIQGGVAMEYVDDFICGTNTWITRAPLPQSREAHAGGLLPNGMIIVSHGFNPSAFTGTATSLFYDPSTNMWNPAPSANVLAVL